jgi:Bifunctional DNA primase/polymerase, N-terminal
VARVDGARRPSGAPPRALGALFLAPGKTASAFKTSAVSVLLSAQSFRDWQHVYADHLIPTFPVQISPAGKKPMVSHYGRFGLRASSEIARKFPDATALGFMAGRRTGLTILDVDTSDERVLADALTRCGPTPVIVRSGSGNYQAWYRYNGEKRLIRPEPDSPIDILGSGFVVAPPSRGTKGEYQFIQGGLDDLDGLPTMRGGIEIAFPPLSPDLLPTKATAQGNRNNSLWRYCMQSAHFCDDFGSLLDVARTYNEPLLTPLSDDEVVKTAKSAWKKTQSGENWFGSHGARLSVEDAGRLVGDPYVLALVIWLTAHNRPDAKFWIADGLKDQLDWSLYQLREARRRAVARGEIKRIRSHRLGKPAVYIFGKTSGFRR